MLTAAQGTLVASGSWLSAMNQSVRILDSMTGASRGLVVMIGILRDDGDGTRFARASLKRGEH